MNLSEQGGIKMTNTNEFESLVKEYKTLADKIYEHPYKRNTKNKSITRRRLEALLELEKRTIDNLEHLGNEEVTRIQAYHYLVQNLHKSRMELSWTERI